MKNRKEMEGIEEWGTSSAQRKVRKRLQIQRRAGRHLFREVRFSERQVQQSMCVQAGMGQVAAKVSVRWWQ